MISKIIFWLIHIEYKKRVKHINFCMPMLYIKGLKKDYPKYLIYTEDENVYQIIDMFCATNIRKRE